MTDLKHELFLTGATWVFVIFSKLATVIPQLQVIAIMLAIFSTFITIMLNIPKVIKLLKGLFK